MDEFVKLDAYYVRLARESLDNAMAKLTQAQNNISSAKGSQSDMLSKDIEKIKRKIAWMNEYWGNLLNNGCTEDK